MAEPTLRDVLDLEEIDRDLYRSRLTYPDPHALYGGQVAAQALLAAGGTVADDRLPHSLHCYFLRRGDAARPTLYRVDRDRDGRSFSARRVVAVQDGEVIANVSCSFAVPAEGPDESVTSAPPAGDPGGQPEFRMPRVLALEGRLPEQPYPEAEWPLRFWVRAVETLPDDELTHACVLTYMSDVGSGLAAFPASTGRMGSSVDHAVWFHRPARLDDWVLCDLVPHTLAAGRGWYTGSVFDPAGRLVASLTQEMLVRSPSRPPRAD
jgi:acyl-CoA thioesterase-2